MLKLPGYGYDAFKSSVYLKASGLNYAIISPLLQIVYVTEPYMIWRK